MDENVKYFIAGALFAVTLLKVLAKVLNGSQDKRKK
jgi:hypothetical protein